MAMALFDWKSIFTLALVVLLGWYLFTTQGGSKYLSAINSLLGSLKLPNVFSGQTSVETGNTTVRLSVQNSLLYGKSFYVKGSSFTGTGTCDLNVTSSINVKSQNISIDITDGQVTFAQGDGKTGVSIQGTSSGFRTDGNKVFPTDKGFDISVGCTSDNFVLTSVLENTITFSGASGSVSGDRGSLKLNNDTVDAQGFSGLLQVSGSAANLNGTVLKILLNGEKAII